MTDEKEIIIAADGAPVKIPEKKKMGMPKGGWQKKGHVDAKPSKASSDADVNVLTLLSEDDKVALRKKARDNVLRDMKKEAEQAFLSKEERKEIIRQKQKTGDVDMDEMVDFVCDLADYAAHIMVNNINYYHGFSYKVPRHVCRDLMAIAAKTWDHDADIHGEKWNPRKKRNQRLSMKDAA